MIHSGVFELFQINDLFKGRFMNGTVQSLCVAMLVMSICHPHESYGGDVVSISETSVVQDATFAPTTQPDGQIEALAIQPDGKLLIAGSFFSVDGFPSRSVARLNSDGSVDRTFHPHLEAGINGPVHVLQLLPDGSVLIAGEFSVVQGYQMTYGLPSVARLRSDGVLDLGFVPYGIPQTTEALALQTDGKILMAGGSSFSGPQLGRHLPNGAPDPAFRISGGFRGKTFLTVGVQSDGSIVAGGDFFEIGGLSRFSLVRFHADGSLDKNFDVRLSPKPGIVIVRSLIVQPDDKIVIAGYFSIVNGVERPGLARLKADGSLDASFDPANGATVGFSNVRSLVPAPDGDLFWVGTGSPFLPDRRSGIVRLDSSGKLDVRFNPAFGSASQLSFANAAVLQPDGRVIVAGAVSQLDGRVIVARPEVRRLFGNSTGLRGVGISALTTNRVAEGSSLEVIIERLGELDLEPLIATLETKSRTALAGQDFVPISINVTIQPGARTTTVSIPIFHDGKAELEETLELVLSNPASGFYLGGAARFSVSITDNDQPSIVDMSFRPDRFSWGPIAVQQDGKIFVTEGRYAPPDRPSSERTSTLWRLHPNGSLDTSFQQTILSNSISRVVPHADGKIFVATGPGYFDYITSLTRLNADGTLDPGFSATNFFLEQLRNLTVRPDGTVLVATSGGVSLLNEAGTRDNLLKFQSAVFQSPARPTAFTVQADGKFLLHHNEPTIFNYISVQRHLSDGSLDLTFQSPSFSTRDTSASVTAIAAATDGSVFFAGPFKHINGIQLPGLAKLRSNGWLDLDFHADPSVSRYEGYPRYPYDSKPTIISISALPDGKLLVLAYRFGLVTIPLSGSIPGDSLIRLNSDSSLDSEFQFDRMFKGQASISAMAVQPDGNILLQAASREIWGDNSRHLMRIFGSSHSVSRIGFSADNFSVGESTGVPRITVRREGDVGGSANVELRLSSGSAIEGEDFGAFATTLQFAPFETEKFVALPVRDDPFAESDETLTAVLTPGPNTGLNLGTATVTLVDDDRPGSLDFTFVPEFSGPKLNEYLAVSKVAVLENGMIAAETIRNGIRALEFLGPAGSLRAKFPGTNASFALIGTAAMTDRSVFVWAYIGGSRQLVELKADGSIAKAIPVAIAPFVNDVSALPLADGSFLVFGNFVRSKDGKSRTIEHLMPDGSWDEGFNVALPNYQSVRTATLDGSGHILLGGTFTSINGVTNSGIARIKLDGTLDDSFKASPGVSAVTASAAIYTISLQTDGRIILGGAFDSYNGVPRRNLARLNPDGSLDATYDPAAILAQGETQLGSVQQIVLQKDGKAVALFSELGSHPSEQRLARFNLDGTVDQVVNLSGYLDVQVSGFSVQENGQILIGGYFRTVKGLARPALARLNAETPLRIHSLAPRPNGFASLVVAVLSGQRYVLEKSSDLNAWSSISTNLAASARLELEDNTSTDPLPRFYRVRRAP